MILRFRCAERALLFYFQAAAGTALEPGIVAVIQTFGDRINFHPHLHFLVTEGGVDGADVFHKVSSFDDGRITEIFSGGVLRFLVGKELLSPEWAERLLTWRHAVVLEVDPIIIGSGPAKSDSSSKYGQGDFSDIFRRP